MSDQPTSLLIRAGNFCLYLLTALLVVFAVLISAVRYHPNVSDIVENNIESKLADIINADIKIESFDLDRRQTSPKILAENVLITDRADPNNSWHIKKVLLGIDLAGSLWARSLRVTELVVEGIDFEVHRDSNGDVKINQTFLIPAGAMNNQRSGSNIGNVEIQLTDSNLIWRDEILNIEYIFNELNMSINATSKGHQLSLLGRLPVEMGNEIELHIQVDGDLEDINEANSTFYLRANRVVTQEISNYFEEDKNISLPVIADVETWGNLQGLSLQSLRGNIFLDGISSAAHVNKACLSDSYIKNISAQFLWQVNEDGWILNANDVYVETSTEDWPASYLHISENSLSANASSYHANIGYLKVDDICNTLQAYQEYGFDVNSLLKNYQLSGVANDFLIRANMVDNQLQALQYAGKVIDLEIKNASANQVVKGISGYTQGSLKGGVFSVDTERLIVSVPNFYKEAPLEFAIKGDLAWNKQDKKIAIQSDDLKVSNADLAMDLRLYTLLDGDQIYVDSQINLPETRAEVVWKYFPTIKKTIRTKNWLRQALHRGTARDTKIIIRGDMRRFPFKDYAGVFETRVDVSNGLLEFKRDWPKLDNVSAKVSIDDARIRVTSNQASLYDTKLKNIDIKIESFLLAVMYGSGVAEGSAKDLLKFLDESNLVSGENSIINTIALDGDSRLELDFSRTLSLRVDHPFQVQGNLHFLGNTLGIPVVGLELNDIGGQFSFDKTGATAEAVNATLYGNPIRLSAQPIGEGATNISFAGPFNLDRYIDQRYAQFAGVTSGTSHVDGLLRLPSMFKKNNPEKISVNLKSNLLGVDIDLPAPFSKSTDETIDSVLTYSNKENSLQFEIGELAELYFKGETRQPLQLKQVTLGANEDDSVVEQDNLLVRGEIDELHVDDWLQVAKQYSAKNKSSTKNYPDIDVIVNDLQWKTWPTKNLALQAKIIDDVYRMKVNSAQGEGLIRIPQQEDLPITADFKHLTFNKGKEKSDFEIKPTEVRPFLFKSDKLVFNDLNFKNVSVRAAKEPRGLSFNRIQLEARDLTVNGSGAWRILDQDQEQSFFNWELVSIDVEDSIEDIGFKSGIHRGDADSIVNMRWDGAPYKFSLDSAQGSVSFNVREGRIKEVDPGNAGRLLALLNLSAISRRLSLDFKDVTKEGFTFDTITGALHLEEGGLLRAEDVTINSSSAKIVISGITNLKNKTYNQKILVTPALSGTLTATGAIVGGPVGAAAGLLADQVAKVVGLNKVSEIEYKMTGTWEEPQLEKVGSVLVKQSTNK